MKNQFQPSLQDTIDQLLTVPGGQPGCAVGVMREGELLLARGYGLASVEHGVPLTERSVFRIASVSKQFTVAAALMLAAQGRLDLRADMRHYLPELPELAHVVRIEHLMRNTSGLPDFLELLRLGGLGLDARLGRAAMLHCLQRNRHLSFAPGAQFLYSNSNFLLLGLIVERISGQGLGDFLQQRIFAPLGMIQTCLDVPCDSVRAALATAYLPEGANGLRRAMHGFEHGGEGGLVSSVHDLLLWGAELLQPRLLAPELVQQLTSPTQLNNGSASSYARGVELGSWAGQPCFGHGGLWPGYRTEFLVLPQPQLALAVISNHGAINPYRLAREVAQQVLSTQAGTTLVAVPTVAPEPPTALRGEWINTALPAVFQLDLLGGELQATQWGVPFALALQTDGSYLPWRGAFEFRLHPRTDDAVDLDVGAGQVARFERLVAAPALPADLLGSYRSDDLATLWTVATAGAPASNQPAGDGSLQLQVEGPLLRGSQAWTLRPLAPDLFEVIATGYPATSTMLARVLRDAAGAVLGLEVFSSRIRRLRFHRFSE